MRTARQHQNNISPTSSGDNNLDQSLFILLCIYPWMPFRVWNKILKNRAIVDLGCLPFCLSFCLLELVFAQ